MSLVLDESSPSMVDVASAAGASDTGADSPMVELGILSFEDVAGASVATALLAGTLSSEVVEGAAEKLSLIAAVIPSFWVELSSETG